MDDLLFALFKLLDDWSPFFQPDPDDVSQNTSQRNDYSADDKKSHQETVEDSGRQCAK